MLLNGLRQRELGLNNYHYHHRRLYRGLPLNARLANQESPHMLPRRFSPRGTYLISYGSDQQSLMLHRVEYVDGASGWQEWFTMEWEQRVAEGGASLSRDCCLVDEDERWLVVASLQQANGASNTANPYQMRSLAGQLEDVVFYLIRLSDGQVLDRIQFTSEQIQLSGVSLFQDRLVICRLYSQEVYIYWIRGTKLLLLHRIGYSLWPDDALTMRMAGHDPLETAETTLQLGFRQAWLSHVYRQSKDPLAFYSAWSWLSNLWMSKVMMISTDTLLIKLSPSDGCTPRTADQCPPSCCMIIWSLSLRSIVRWWRANSEEFFHFFYRQLQPDTASFYHPTCTSSAYESYWLERQLDLYAAAKDAGYPAARRRLLASTFTQSSSCTSPYLDSDIFRFDEKTVGVDRPKQSSDYPIRWFNRETDESLFYLDSSTTAAPFYSHDGNNRKYTSWIFHPHLPLALSYSHGLMRSTCFNIYFHKGA